MKNKVITLAFASAALSYGQITAPASSTSNPTPNETLLTIGVNDFTAIEGTTGDDYVQSFSGDWGSVDLSINVTAASSVVLATHNSRLNDDEEVYMQAGQALTFTFSYSNLSLAAGYSLGDAGLNTLTLRDAADAGSDTGTISFNGGVATAWNTVSELPGNVGGANFTAFTGAPYDSYTITYTGGDYMTTAAFASMSITQVPEPTSAALLGLGGLALVTRRKR